MKTISLLHPFSAKAIGLNEFDLYESHSKPHELALLDMQKKGYAVTIDYFTGRWVPYKKKPNAITKRFWTVTYPLYKKRHVWRKQKSVLHYFYNMFNSPDLTIINMSGHGSSYCFKLARLLIKKKKPYIAMIGGIHMSMTGNTLKYYQNANHLIVHTDIQKKELQKNKEFKKLNIRVMPLGVDIQKFKPSKTKNKDSCNLLFVGRISRLKQIEIAIEALAKLVENNIDNARLIIIGPQSDKNYFNELSNLICKLNIEKNVIFKGVIVHEKLISHYQNADILLLPSAHESFGMVMVEAMACGTPVIALKDSGGPDEIIECAVDGILSTPQNYTADILNYFKNKEQQFIISSNARTKVLENYSLESTYKVLKTSIEDALKLK